MSDTSLASLGKSSCWMDPKSFVRTGRPARAGKSMSHMPRESDGGEAVFHRDSWSQSDFIVATSPHWHPPPSGEAGGTSIL